MAGYKWQFKSALSYNSIDPSVASQHTADDPGDMRLEYDQSPVVGFGMREFRFVTLSAASTNLSIGDLCYMSDVAGTLATTVMASALGAGTGPSRNTIAGFANAGSLLTVAAGGSATAITAGNQGWVQTKGFHPGINVTGATVALGDQIVATATSKVAVNVASGTAVTYLSLGVAVSVNTGNFCQARLWIPT